MAQQAFRDYDDLTWLGIVENAHGIKGELRVRPLTSDVRYYEQRLREVFLEIRDQLIQIEVERISQHKSKWLIKFETINDRNEAESMKGARLLILDTDLKPLEDGEFHLHALANAAIISTEGAQLGRVADVMEIGPRLVLVCETGTKTEFLVPFESDMVEEIDWRVPQIVITPYEGLISEEK